MNTALVIAAIVTAIATAVTAVLTWRNRSRIFLELGLTNTTKEIAWCSLHIRNPTEHTLIVDKVTATRPRKLGLWDQSQGDNYGPPPGTPPAAFKSPTIVINSEIAAHHDTELLFYLSGPMEKRQGRYLKVRVHLRKKRAPKWTHCYSVLSANRM